MEDTVINEKKASKASIIFGILYGLVAAGFYVTPVMFFLLGAASLSTAIAMQNILIQNFGWLFLCLGLLLTLTTVMIYLQRKNVAKLTIAEIRPYRAFVGGISIALLITYATLATMALFTL
ncbi:hypothetical protein COU86_01775 [Candidatus Roizmanbacteria bacterium CG10_big_fil_rev_8_21_14_0_10_36_26]|uniref:Uncharacterized protein n=1 Tax=Candidatus Roizmanbacteria bacterium CG10_big_fil_rev_8_21_14_0_10_36_26 TaxID=1974851 RepID=A0A2M8KLX6_9BACT|nr:MAG: hypothetical protein CO166_03100 [Candidatus Roizmanbacteria bacterium CG_4_9_14_3_um_filter_36_11]PJE60922.1 MAG: hypothetical protein COU86_01775 [Candidatus Roizmanbacteria bacterium CG10_big_fil_rev_8_21_14_0_10_36_26]